MVIFTVLVGVILALIASTAEARIVSVRIDGVEPC